MKEVIYLNRKFINDDRIGDAELLLISLIIANKTEKLVFDRISLKYLLSFLYDGTMSQHLRELFDHALWNLDELKIIREAEVMDNFVVKAKLRGLGRESGEECLKIYSSDIFKIFSRGSNYNFLKVFRLYITIMDGMSYPSSFPDFYKNKIYWEGTKNLIKRAKISKPTYHKYLDYLRDVHVFYLKRDKYNHFFPVCICRCKDRRLCKQFSLRLRTYMRSFGYEEKIARTMVLDVK